MSFKDTKRVIRGRLELNYNDVKIDITRRFLVGEHQYFFIPIVCDVDFRNMIEMFIQGGTNITKLHVSSLFMNLSWMHMSLFHLPLLEGFRSIPLFSLGLGILTCLYRYFCQASLKKSKQIEVCLFFL